MTARRDPAALQRRIRVSLAMSDPLLAQRIGALLSGDDGLDVTIGLDDARAPDVTLADHVHGLPAPLIVMDDGTQEPEELDADVRAVLPASIDADLLRAAIRLVAAGFVISDANELRGFSELSARIDRPPGVDEGEIVLTARENEVLALLAHGAPNKLIARQLAISVHTAKFHVASVLAKLGARNRSDAVAIGIRRGLILL